MDPSFHGRGSKVGMTDSTGRPEDCSFYVKKQPAKPPGN